jgi:hypothetical protein
MAALPSSVMRWIEIFNSAVLFSIETRISVRSSRLAMARRR